MPERPDSGGPVMYFVLPTLITARPHLRLSGEDHLIEARSGIQCNDGSWKYQECCERVSLSFERAHGISPSLPPQGVGPLALLGF